MKRERDVAINDLRFLERLQKTSADFVFANGGL